ncbi:hypothetical protein SAY86_014570 [Trapa natans]|uniref:Uncharacterized protein n=1 Tax=Trapa natans TaxID=22666 RepID=A0AAN7KZF8_TRANT|nr:hypothetical protein SAY86_014570 [Trapa natans]
MVLPNAEASTDQTYPLQSKRRSGTTLREQESKRRLESRSALVRAPFSRLLLRLSIRALACSLARFASRASACWAQTLSRKEITETTAEPQRERPGGDATRLQRQNSNRCRTYDIREDGQAECLKRERLKGEADATDAKRRQLPLRGAVARQVRFTDV